MRETEVDPHLLGDPVEVPVEERLVRERVRRPELDARAVAAHSPDLAEDVVRTVDVLEEVRGEDLVDGIVRERERIGGEIDDVIDLGTGKHVEPDESLTAGASAAEIDAQRGNRGFRGHPVHRTKEASPVSERGA